MREFQWCEADGEEVDLAEKLELNVVMKRPLKAKAVPLRPPLAANNAAA